jgi:hypothetical protein
MVMITVTVLSNILSIDTYTGIRKQNPVKISHGFPNLIFLLVDILCNPVSVFSSKMLLRIDFLFYQMCIADQFITPEICQIASRGL